MLSRLQRADPDFSDVFKAFESMEIVAEKAQIEIEKNKFTTGRLERVYDSLIKDRVFLEAEAPLLNSHVFAHNLIFLCCFFNF